MSEDPIIQHHRTQISELDLKILDTINQRIHLVKQLKDHKTSHGLSFYDAAQENRVITALRGANPGPLSSEGLGEIFRLIMEWSKLDAAALGNIKPD